ncbi:MAG: peptidoglycan DD-metalloendopeptidase family protein [Clostridia bacterium]|nr:peptidoglycan DD-metalloendopeptidase family protein [Clostridia bacterium]
MKTNQFVRNKKLLSFISLFITTVILFGCFSFAYPQQAQAKSLSEINDTIKTLDKHLADLEREKQSVEKAALPALTEANRLNNIIIMYQDKINALNSRISAYQKQIDSLESEIKTLDAQISDQEKIIKENEEKLGKRLRALYMAGENSTLEVILTADNMTSLLTRIELMKNVSDNDMKLINKVKFAILKIQQSKKAKEAKIKVLENNKKKIEADKQDEVAAQKKVAAERAKLDGAVNAYKAEMSRIANDKRLASIYLAQMERERRQYDAYINSQISSGSGKVGDLVCPIYETDRYITSLYGRRKLYGQWDNHTGLDITCGNKRANLHAAHDGIVVKTVYSNFGLGNHVILDNGDGLSTTYAHMSSLSVVQGQKVKKGDILGQMGSTGNSTGPHLHLEIKINKKRVNPLPYMPPMQYRG